MMPNFAVIDGQNVVNVVFADSKEIAEEITGKSCIECTNNPYAEPGGTYVDGVFYQRKQFPSWVLNEDNYWVPPVAHPEIDEENPKEYVWNEATVSWKQV